MVSIETLEVGDLIEGPAVFPTLAPKEKVCFLVASKLSEGDSVGVVLSASLFGVYIGSLSASSSPGCEVVWSWGDQQ